VLSGRSTRSGDSIWRTRRARRRPKAGCDIASRQLACRAPPGPPQFRLPNFSA
jgi:hypothetical protein